MPAPTLRRTTGTILLEIRGGRIPKATRKTNTRTSDRDVGDGTSTARGRALGRPRHMVVGFPAQTSPKQGLAAARRYQSSFTQAVRGAWAVRDTSLAVA